MPQALQCPRCQGAVTVPDHASGTRVKCPHCDETFLAPGVAASANDDDDWLVLDSDPVAPKPGGFVESTPASSPNPAAPPQTTPATPTPAPRTTGPAPPVPAQSVDKNVGPPLSDDDEALLSEFSADLDEFTAGIETPPPPASDPMDSGPLETVDAFQALPPMLSGNPVPSANAGPEGGTPRPPKPPAAQPVEYESEFRVKCSICGSILYAKANQSGKTLQCSDCHSPVKIPPAPKKRAKPQIDVENAQTFALEQSQTAERKDPFKRSAEELLEEASREEEASPSNVFDDVPSIKDWAKGVFGIFLDPGVLVHWLGLSFIASVPACIALSFENPILYLGLMAGGFFLGAITVSCGFAILQSVANGEESVSEWPVFDPIGWISQLFVALAASMIAAVPAWVLSSYLAGPSLISVAITMMSVYAVFPFVLLSMLDMQSPFIPFSAEVARSVTKCEEAWGGFYFSSGALFVAMFLSFAIASTLAGPVSAVISIFLAVGGTFVYFAMIGRLAYSIGQTVNEPPMKNDIDRDQPTRTHDGSIN